MANQPAADDLPLSLRFFSPSLSYALFFFLSSLLLKQIYRVATFFFPLGLVFQTIQIFAWLPALSLFPRCTCKCIERKGGSSGNDNK